MLLSCGLLYGREMVVVSGPWNVLKIRLSGFAGNPSFMAPGKADEGEMSNRRHCTSKLVQGRCWGSCTPCRSLLGEHSRTRNHNYFPQCFQHLLTKLNIMLDNKWKKKCKGPRSIFADQAVNDEFVAER